MCQIVNFHQNLMVWFGKSYFDKFWLLYQDPIHICQSQFSHWNRELTLVILITMNPINGWVFQFCIFINQEAWILLMSWKDSSFNSHCTNSLFCRKDKLGWWNNILFNLYTITYLYKLSNLNFNQFWPNTSHFKIIVFFWSVKSGSTLAWKTRITFYSLNISKNKNLRAFWICAFERGYP